MTRWIGKQTVAVGIISVDSEVPLHVLVGIPGVDHFVCGKYDTIKARLNFFREQCSNQTELRYQATHVTDHQCHSLIQLRSQKVSFLRSFLPRGKKASTNQTYHTSFASRMHTRIKKSFQTCHVHTHSATERKEKLKKHRICLLFIESVQSINS